MSHGGASACRALSTAPHPMLSEVGSRLQSPGEAGEAVDPSRRTVDILRVDLEHPPALVGSDGVAVRVIAALSDGGVVASLVLTHDSLRLPDEITLEHPAAVAMRSTARLTARLRESRRGGTSAAPLSPWVIAQGRGPEPGPPPAEPCPVAAPAQARVSPVSSRPTSYTVESALPGSGRPRNRVATSSPSTTSSSRPMPRPGSSPRSTHVSASPVTGSPAVNVRSRSSSPRCPRQPARRMWARVVDRITSSCCCPSR